MTEHQNPDEGPAFRAAREEWEARIALGDMLPGTGFADSAARLRENPWPENLNGTPVVLDTATAWGPGTALAVAAAARHRRDLAMVLTGEDSTDSARRLLDALERGDVAVTADPRQAAALADGDLPVRWVSPAGPATLAGLLAQPPGSVSGLRVTLAQPADDEPPAPGTPEAARSVLDAVHDGLLAVPDLVSGPADSTDLSTLLRSLLTGPAAPAWAPELAAAIEPSPDGPTDLPLGPAAAVGSALALPFTDMDRVPVGVDAQGRFTRQDDGVPVWWGTVPDAGAFGRWLVRTLGAPAGDGSAAPGGV